MEEFTKGIEKSCKGNPYSSFPQAFKFFIDSSFRTIDVDGELSKFATRGTLSLLILFSSTCHYGYRSQYQNLTAKSEKNASNKRDNIVLS